MALSSLLSVMLNYGLSIWQLEMSQNIDRPNHPATHSNILLILRQLEKLISCMLWILTSLFDSFQTIFWPLQQNALEGKDTTMPSWHTANERCIRLSGTLSSIMNSWRHMYMAL
jgi:hypothetical protein